MRRLAVIVLALLFATVASASTTYYVKKTGSDSNPGTEAEPFLTIQKGLDSSTGVGDNVYVYAGTYTETTAYSYVSTRYTLMHVKYGGSIAAPNHVKAMEPGVILDGQSSANNCSWMRDINNVVVDGFECKNIVPANASGAYHNWQTDNVVYRNQNLHDMTGGDVENKAGFFVMGKRTTVRDSLISIYNAAGISGGMSGYTFDAGLIDNNDINMLGLGNGAYISQNTNDYVIRNNYIHNVGHSFVQIRDCVRAKVYNNIFYDFNGSPSFGFQFRDWSDDSPSDQNDQNEFYNNVIDGGGGGTCFTMTGQDNVIIRNNIMMNCTNIWEDTNWANGWSQGIIITNNIYYGYTNLHEGAWGGTYSETSNQENTNPLFVGSGNKPYPYYSLQATSPAIDNGYTVSPEFADQRGVDRPIGAGWDIGVYEYDTGAGDTTPDAFSFTDITGAAQSTQYASNAITVTGIDNETAISISGNSGEYRINSGPWTLASGTVALNDNVTVRQTSSGSYSAAVNTTLTVGGVSDTYTVTTLADPGAPETIPVLSPGVSLSGGVTIH